MGFLRSTLFTVLLFLLISMAQSLGATLLLAATLEAGFSQDTSALVQHEACVSDSLATPVPDVSIPVAVAQTSNPKAEKQTNVPAEFKTVQKTVVLSPAQVIEREVPAQYRTIQKVVLVQPETTRVIHTPAVYGTIERKVLVNTPKKEIEEVATEDSETKSKLSSEEEFSEWIAGLCNAEGHSLTVAQIQMALTDRGYDPGPIDNIMGPLTRQALQHFRDDYSFSGDEMLAELGVDWEW